MEDNDSILMLRKYESNKLKSTLEKLPLFEQVFLMNSLILIVQHLHLRKIYIGKKFSESIFVDGRKVVIEPAENGTLDEDICKLTLVVREWVKSMPNG